MSFEEFRIKWKRSSGHVPQCLVEGQCGWHNRAAACLQQRSYPCVSLPRTVIPMPLFLGSGGGEGLPDPHQLGNSLHSRSSVLVLPGVSSQSSYHCFSQEVFGNVMQTSSKGSCGRYPDPSSALGPFLHHRAIPNGFQLSLAVCIFILKSVQESMLSRLTTSSYHLH